MRGLERVEMTVRTRSVVTSTHMPLDEFIFSVFAVHNYVLLMSALNLE